MIDILNVKCKNFAEWDFGKSDLKPHWDELTEPFYYQIISAKIGSTGKCKIFNSIWTVIKCAKLDLKIYNLLSSHQTFNLMLNNEF